MKSSAITRRNLIKSAGVLTAAAAISGTSVAMADVAEWAGEADILVLGTGGAGLCAGITALDEELGSVLVLEAAPEELAGGNTRVSGQLMFIPNTPEEAVRYQSNLNGPYKVDEQLVQAWAENICENLSWFEYLGADLREATSCNPEFADVDGSEGCHTYLHEGVTGRSVLWDFLMEVAEDDYDLEIEYEARAVKLIFSDDKKEVIGVATEDGRCFKALKGVILACGGWENNPELMNTYYTCGYPDMAPAGTPFNRGDGLIMAQAAGAALWHMNNFSLANLAARVSNDSPCVSFPRWATKDYIYVGPNSKRYCYEETTSLNKHGKTKRDGMYVSQHVPMPLYAIFGKTAFETGNLFPTYPYLWSDLIGPKDGETNQDYVDAGLIVTADTIAELAQKIGLDPKTLEETVTRYNEFCAAGKDEDYGRGEDYYGNFSGMVGAGALSSQEESIVIPAFELMPIEPPYYAFRQYISILNSQGGPKRSAKGEVLDTEGNPIPRLFSAGELGCIYSYQYNGGGNVSEACSSGRLAARSCGALERWC
ncbi:MAG: FAD-binding protein [Coriobacteriales bacterium]|nr:FAD-binding protein [Coriobacteriales bacterium]